MSKRKRTDDSQTKHHRLPKADNGELSIENISYVPFYQHMAYNVLFSDGHLHPKEIARRLSDVWIRPDFLMIAIPRCQPCNKCISCTLEEKCQSITGDNMGLLSQDM